MDRTHLEQTPYDSVALLVQKLFSNSLSERERAHEALRNFPDPLVVCRVACRSLRKGKWQKRNKPGDYLIKLCRIIGEIGDGRCQSELLRIYRVFRENTAWHRWSGYLAWVIVQTPDGRQFALKNLDQSEIGEFFSGLNEVSLLIEQFEAEQEGAEAKGGPEQVIGSRSGTSWLQANEDAGEGKAQSGKGKKSDQETRRKFTAANAKCLLGIHDWKGCVCSNCGQVRDEAHNWSENCEKCAICGKTRANAHNWGKNCEKCSICREIRLNHHEWVGCRCQRCGNLNYDARNKLLKEIEYGKRDLVDLSELVGCNIVSVSGVGVSIEKVRLKITLKESTSKVTVQIQPEIYVRAVGGNHQNMAIRESTKVELRPFSSTWVVLDAVCINADRKVPTDRDRFEGVSWLSADVRRYIEATRGKKTMVIQAGVWILTDRLSDFDLKKRLMIGGRFAISQPDIDEARAILRSLGIS